MLPEILTFEQLVRSAFADAPKLAIEDNSTDLQYEPEVDFSQYWWDLSPAFVNPENARSLSQATFLFLLPLYLIATVRYEWCSRGALLKVLYTPGSPDANPPEDWWSRFGEWNFLVNRLSGPQKHAIRVWLEIVNESERYAGGYSGEIEEMLANYWGAY